MIMNYPHDGRSVNISFEGEFVCSSLGRIVAKDAPVVDLTEYGRLLRILVTGRSDEELSREILSSFLLQQCDASIGQEFFDAEWYSSRYGSFGNLHPLLHYLMLGDEHGHRPHRGIWTRWVKDRASERARTALQLVIDDGALRAPNPFFDPIYYLEQNPDVFRAGVSAWGHYEKHGRAERRSPHKLIDWTWYSRFTGTEVPDIDLFFHARWSNGIFPHPLSRTDWAHAPIDDLVNLFEYNLSPTVEVFAPSSNPNFELSTRTRLPPRSIVPVFDFVNAERLENSLRTKYESDRKLRNVKVSVILPTKDRLQKLQHAVASVLTQTHRNFQLIVVNDGGTDGSSEWLRRISDDRIVVVDTAPQGVSAARNKGLDCADGEYVAFLDSDNAWTPSFLANMIAYSFLTSSDFSYSALRLFNDSGEVRYRYREYSAEDYWKANYIDMNVIFHQREKFKNVRFDEGLRRCVDWDYILKLCEIRSPVGLPVIGCDYYHDAKQVDRITLNAPAADCFCVSQRHRPSPLKVPVDHVVVYAILKEDYVFAYRDLSITLRMIDSTIKIQVVTNMGFDQDSFSSITALLASAGQPDPLLAISPLGYGGLQDYARSQCKFEPKTWTFFCSNVGKGLNQFLSILVDGSQPTIVANADKSGLVDALLYREETKRWQYSKVKNSRASVSMMPLSLCAFNISANEVGQFDLRFSDELALPLLMIAIASKIDLNMITVLEDDARSYNIAALLNSINEFSQLGIFYPSRMPDLKWLRADTEYSVENSFLCDIPVLRTIGETTLAIMTPAPHAGSGWGDEYFAESLCRAFNELGVKSSTVYRSHWKDVHREFSHALHLKGIVDIEPMTGAKNAMWIISHPDRLNERDLWACEEIFTASESHAAMISHILGRNAVFLPQCSSFCPPPDFFELQESAANGLAIFVGDSKKVLRYPIDALLKTWESVYLIGPNWGEAEYIRRKLVAEHVPNDQLQRIYAGFGAVLNQHWPDMAKNGFVSNRLFDVAACGGFFITDRCTGLSEELLKHGVVWNGGPIEEYFERRRGRSAADRFDKALKFSTSNSFKARAQVIVDRWIRA